MIKSSSQNNQTKLSQTQNQTKSKSLLKTPSRTPARSLSQKNPIIELDETNVTTLSTSRRSSPRLQPPPSKTQVPAAVTTYNGNYVTSTRQIGASQIQITKKNKQQNNKIDPPPPVITETDANTSTREASAKKSKQTPPTDTETATATTAAASNTSISRQARQMREVSVVLNRLSEEEINKTSRSTRRKNGDSTSSNEQSMIMNSTEIERTPRGNRKNANNTSRGASALASTSTVKKNTNAKELRTRRKNQIDDDDDDDDDDVQVTVIRDSSDDDDESDDEERITTKKRQTRTTQKRANEKEKSRIVAQETLSPTTRSRSLNDKNSNLNISFIFLRYGRKHS